MSDAISGGIFAEPYQLGGSTAYTYDVNGNMKTRANSTNSSNNITAITYNYLNLAQQITAVAGTTSYTYDAGGRKLRSVFEGTATDYIDGIEYQDGILNFIHMEEGRIVKSGTTYSYEYMLRDHLGNTRSGFNGNSPTVASIKSDYYPFGLQYQSGIVAGSPNNKYLYNEKELSSTGHTTPGNCSVHIENWGSITQKVDFTCFCKTSNHQTPANLGSNGGVSYCVG